MAASITVELTQESFIEWPGERVETRALFAPARIPKVVPVAAMETALVPAGPSESLLTADALQAALLAVVVLTASAAALTAMFALLLFR